MRMKLAEPISVATRKDWKPLRSVSGLWRAWGVHSVFIHEDISF